jgi:hypothetical protein
MGEPTLRGPGGLEKAIPNWVGATLALAFEEGFGAAHGRPFRLPLSRNRTCYKGPGRIEKGRLNTKIDFVK